MTIIDKVVTVTVGFQSILGGQSQTNSNSHMPT